MTVEELIEALKALPADAMRRQVVFIETAPDGNWSGEFEMDVSVVDYDLRVVTLR